MTAVYRHCERIEAIHPFLHRGMGCFASLHPSYGNGISRRRLCDGVLAGEQVKQRALDRGLPGRRADLGAEQVGDVEHVAGAFAEGRDMGGGNVEVELRDRGRQLIQQAGAVEAGDLDHGVAVRPLIVDDDLGLDHERAHLAAGGRLAGHHLGQPQFAFQHLLDHLADAGRAPALVLVAVVFP